MATTTNYGWTTPNDTDLVKDGAAAIRTLGSSVDTTTKALNPSTTLGDIEYRSATANTNTRLGIGSTGQVLTVAGGVPTWATSDDANAIQNAIVDAKGDLIAASAADTPARLAVGTNGQVLTADSAEATGLKWATPGGGGKVLQVVQVSYSTEYTNTGNTYTDTGLSASITPSATNSKVLVMVNQQTWSKRQTNNSGGAALKLLRGATDIYVPAPSKYELQYSEINNATGAVEIAAMISLCYLDSPSTTSSTTYKTQGSSAVTTNTPTVKCQQGSAISTITLLEIGA